LFGDFKIISDTTIAFFSGYLLCNFDKNKMPSVL